MASANRGFTVGNMPPQRQEHTPHWSKGDLVKVRSKTADNWRDAYVLIQRGRNLLLVIPEGMVHPDGSRQTRLSLVAEEQPGAYHRSLDGADYEVRASPLRSSPQRASPPPAQQP